MKKNFIFVANWKMNLNFDEEINFATNYFDNFIKLGQIPDTSIILCPSFVSLYPISQIFKETSVNIGAQNCSKYPKGPHTGQISCESLTHLNCKYCIIGHSESRKDLNESISDISQKFNFLVYHKISPILCIGETINDFEQKKVFEILDNELEIIKKALLQTSIPDYLDICIAYEPIWAIGTGKAASVDHLETIFSWLHTQTQKISTFINWKLLYGGSVNAKNITNLKKIELLDGFLIGGTSLNFQEFEKIVKL